MTAYTGADYRAARAELARDMADEPVARHWTRLCPLCRGGRTRELSLSVDGNNDGYVWYCFRASCGFKGHAGKCGPEQQTRTGFEPRPFEGAMRWPTAEEARYHGLSSARMAHDAGLYVDPDEPTTAIWECRGLGNTVLGHQTRTANKTIRTYRQHPAFYHVVRPHPADPGSMWIVEDPKSAARLGYHFPVIGVALFGTHMTRIVADHLTDYARLHGLRVYVALDPGAENEAHRIIRQFIDYGVPVSYVPLQADIKDLDYGVLVDLVTQYTPRNRS